MLGYGRAVDCESYPTTLPSVLAEYLGYKTIAVGKNHFGIRKFSNGTDSGEFITHGYQRMSLYDGLTEIPDDYDKYFDSVHPGVDPLSTCNLGWNDWRACPYEFDEYDHPTSWTTRRAVDEIESYDFDTTNSSPPMMLKVSYHRPHSPYDPPKRLFDKHMSRRHGSKYARNVNNDGWDKEYLNTTEMPPDAWHGDPGDPEARKSRAAYLANVELVDEGVGLILDALDRRGVLLDNVFIAWVSDHSDMLGDHNLWRKGYPYEAASHVNMMMKLPGQREGIESDAIVEIRDVAPTIYDLLGALDYVTKIDPLINGKSLVPVLTSKIKGVRNRLDLEHNTVYDERIHWNAIVGYLGGKLYKYIFFALNGREMLFCLSDDRKERYDLAIEVKYKAVLELWRKAMIRQFQEEGRGIEWVSDDGTTLVVGRKGMTYGSNYPCGTDIGTGTATLLVA